MKSRYIPYIIGVSVFVLASCKTPQMTQMTDRVKMQMPSQFQQDSVVGGHATVTPWKQFFTDPALAALIDTALANNQDLRITLQQIAMAKSNVLYQEGLMMPSVSAGGSVGVSKAGRYTSEGAGNATTEIKPGKEMPDPLMDYQLGANADWEVDLWHKLSSSKRAAVEHYLATVEGRNAVLSSLIAQVAENYYHLLALDNKLDLIHQYIDLQKKAVEIAKIQKSADTDTELAVEKFEAELAKARSEEYTLRQEMTETENNLNLLLGRYPANIQRDKSSFLSTNLQKVMTGIPSELLTNRADIRQAEHELAAAKWNVDAARKEFLPSLNISASLGLDAFNPAYLTRLPKSLAFSVLGGLAGPLINKKAIQANFQTADAQQVEALYEYDKTLLTAYSEVCTLMSKIKNLDQYYQLKEEESNKLDHSIGIARQLYMNSRCTYLDVLMDERDALDAKMELLEAKEQQLSSMVDVYRSLGGGQDSSFSTQNNQ
ncbi:MAG: efflux transporter outer membrane subunit [Prevotella sp.]|jgi:multidrug efflux system outer membrane protein|nr:efflux transporter outer membrane subunit [Prevotella sp.]MCI1281184.1 efflux transporter outer membrane subunit [Prevotella sp.]